ncbi:MAG: AAA family ATPase, partial [Candidatus Helarchaeota archaeon]
LVDCLLIGAITQSSVLLSGSSGSGKTFLAELILSFLFGTDGYTRKNITPDMNEQDFMDIDFGAIKEGKKLKESMIADDLFKQPSLIIDEANRAPPIIQNRLMQILENNIDLKSKTIHAGIPLENGDFYHWIILTLNYGVEYAGTSTVDRALKDRITLDIPIDNFPPTIDDQIKMIRYSLRSKEKILLSSNLDLLLKLYRNFDKLKLTLEAEGLILYLSFTSNCVKSPTGSKYGVAFSPQYCKDQDCPYARNPPLNEICPFTFAPSNRVLRRLVHTAKGFSLLKHAKIINKLKKEKKTELISEYMKSINFKVSLRDIILIAPLILNSKISMNREWVLNKFNGNTFLACTHFLKVINKQLTFFMKSLLPSIVQEREGNAISEKDKGIRKKAVRDDFHFKGLIKYVHNYLT